MSITDLNWDFSPNSKFKYPNLVEIETPPDGSCFFHSLCLAFYKPYIYAEMGQNQMKRSAIIEEIRKELSRRLGENMNPKDPQSPIVYDTLSNGNLRTLGIAHPKQYSLRALQNTLLNYSHHVDHSLHEFISDILNKDIYFLEANKKEVYSLGKDLGLLYKHRDSIILIHHYEHFNLVGVRNGSRIDTLFDPDHPLIEQIKLHL